MRLETSFETVAARPPHDEAGDVELKTWIAAPDAVMTRADLVPASVGGGGGQPCTLSAVGLVKAG
ncbi:hypothetical protein [Microvirga calopogonii]|uniref:hypothetical protein n=1 Tax=Microvirga calopogonii TaxID=2078013 RepID=UPI000E0D0F2B|nr:hypothetical protein [Microvirga calopogonii]